MLCFAVVFQNCLVSFGSNAIYWSGKQTKNICKQCLIVLNIVSAFCATLMKSLMKQLWTDFNKFYRVLGTFFVTLLRSFLGLILLEIVRKVLFFWALFQRSPHCVREQNGTKMWHWKCLIWNPIHMLLKRKQI